ncbi:DNA replication factor Dna2 [Ancylostoma ceylanicum]|uniref:DNA helicase n=1 Tax=Ancylostoma ceylanicum TaxID=53326 RepID=A0A0D6LJZ1_9BILA|nr:DNA replication factor Dna2 [Ancylostoma ceylanicum]
MSNYPEKGVNVEPGLQKQETASKKRPLCNHSIGNGGEITAVSPVKEVKKMKTDELTPIEKQSTPLKRSPKLDAPQTCSSDFSDWDDSPIKQVLPAKGSTAIACSEVAEKENSEFEDSFDEPCSFERLVYHVKTYLLRAKITVKRSTALRVFTEIGRSPVKKSDSSVSVDRNNSGVAGFPSLCDSKSEVELIVVSVKNEDGLVDLICRSDSGKESVVYLQDHWAELPVGPNTRIRLIGAQPWGESDWLVSNEHGLLIVAPDTLVPCTAIAGSTWCPRKVVLNERFRGQVQANKAMLIGIIMHELFQTALRCPNPRLVTTEWLLGKWQNGLYDEVITQLAAHRFTPSQFETELVPYADVIVGWIQNHLPGGSFYVSNSSTSSVSKVHDIEENIWIPQLGIKGKVDVTLKMHTTAKTQLRPLELKTGKSGQSSEHAAQVMLYSLMLSSRYKEPIGEGSLLYLKDGVTRVVHPRALELKAIINQRNNLALHLSKLNPELLPEYFKKWIRWILSEWSEDQARRSSGVSDLWRISPEESARQRELIVDLAPPSSIRSDAAALPCSVRKILLSSVQANELNEEQRRAVESALVCSDYTLIEGFPGSGLASGPFSALSLIWWMLFPCHSGKTTTIVTLLRCLLEMKCSVLLAANTHSALDNVVAKLRKYVDASKILRLGKSSSGRSAIAELTLESKLSGADGDKYKTARDILKNTPLVASTCHYVPRDQLFSWRKFDYCIVDEASMVLEPVLLSALAAASRFVLVGDAHQLTPLVQNRKCAEEGMSVSLFERLQVHSGALHSLVSQYRMNSVIGKLSSHLFYEDRLVCGNNSVAEACLANSGCFKESTVEEDPWKVIESGLLRDSVVFVDTRAREQADFAMINDGGGMVHNMGEARLVRDVVERFLKNGVSPSDIGVMCVYRKQVDVIKSILDPGLGIEVNSVDQYQGRDKSVVIWSLVWTDTTGRRCELLRDRRRVNVALTRAKHKLILIGCAESMRSMDIMKRVVDSTKVVEDIWYRYTIRNPRCLYRRKKRNG